MGRCPLGEWGREWCQLHPRTPVGVGKERGVDVEESMRPGCTGSSFKLSTCDVHHNLHRWPSWSDDGTSEVAAERDFWGLAPPNGGARRAYSCRARRGLHLAVGRLQVFISTLPAVLIQLYASDTVLWMGRGCLRGCLRTPAQGSLMHDSWCVHLHSISCCLQTNSPKRLNDRRLS